MPNPWKRIPDRTFGKFDLIKMPLLKTPILSGKSSIRHRLFLEYNYPWLPNLFSRWCSGVKFAMQIILRDAFQKVFKRALFLGYWGNINFSLINGYINQFIILDGKAKGNAKGALVHSLNNTIKLSRMKTWPGCFLLFMHIGILIVNFYILRCYTFEKRKQKIDDKAYKPA